MAIFDSTARRQLPAEPTYRAPPHNIEAEQALLGAILVNNEAFYRVSDFLEPKHFLEGIHQRIFELSASLIRAGKLATPVTLKTFLPSDLDIAGLTVNQYLARPCHLRPVDPSRPDHDRRGYGQPRLRSAG
jgi:replicative DNA helicase